MPTRFGITRTTSGGGVFTDRYDAEIWDDSLALDGYVEPFIEIIIKTPFSMLTDAHSGSNNGTFIAEISSNTNDDNLQWTINNWSTTNSVIGGLAGLGGLAPGNYTLKVRTDVANEFGYRYERSVNFEIYRLPVYGTRWRLQFYDIRENQPWTITIKEDGYTGSITDVCSDDGGFVIEYGNQDQELYTPLKTSRAVMNLLVETAGAFNDIIDADDYQFYVEVSRTGSVKWRGFLIGEGYQEQYDDPRYYVQLTAVDGLTLAQDKVMSYFGKRSTRWNHDRIHLTQVMQAINRELRLKDSYIYYYNPVYPSGASQITKPSFYYQYIDLNEMFRDVDDDEDVPLIDLINAVLYPQRCQMHSWRDGIMVRWLGKTAGTKVVFGNKNYSSSYTTSNIDFDRTIGNKINSPDHFFIDRVPLITWQNRVKNIVVKHKYFLDKVYDRISRWFDLDNVFSYDTVGAGSKQSSGDTMGALVLAGDNTFYTNNDGTLQQRTDHALITYFGATSPYLSYMLTIPREIWRIDGYDTRIRLKFKWAKHIPAGTNDFKWTVFCGGYYLEADGSWTAIDIDGSGTDTVVTDTQIDFETGGQYDDEYEIVTDPLPTTLDLSKDKMSVRFYLSSSWDAQALIISDFTAEVLNTIGDIDESIQMFPVEDTLVVEVANDYGRGEKEYEWRYYNVDEFDAGRFPKSNIVDDDQVPILEYTMGSETGTFTLQNIFTTAAAAQYSKLRRIMAATLAKHTDFHTQFILEPSGDAHYLICNYAKHNMKAGTIEVELIELESTSAWPT